VNAPSLLLVENNEGHNYLIQEKFREAFPDAEIIRARTLKEASEFLPTKSWDLVIINERLPDGRAADFLDRLTARQPFAAVAVLTEETGDVAIEFSRHHGAVELLTKDRATLDSFVGRVKRLMAASQRINTLLHEEEGGAGTLFRDPLTGVYNRAYFDESLRREVWRSHRYRQDLAILLVDVDGFLSIIRKEGAPTGEKCLKRLSGILAKSVRSGDIVARYGDDQFMMLLHHCRRSDAVRCANRVLRDVDKRSSSHRFTVSIGVLHHRSESKVQRAKQLVAQAEKALIRAKREGGGHLHIAA
jgi:diguanylate cyclase (GGDEF)-like protein